MMKTLFVSVSILLISCFFTFSSAFGNDTGDIQAFNSNTGFYYTVQKGDTLWDLSQKFYSSEWDWPGLWELNNKIKNPHLIYPGQKLRVFFKGGLSLHNKPVYKKPANTQEEQAPIEVEVEKVEKVSSPEPEKKEIQLTFAYPFIDRVGFIKTKAVTPVGKILRSKMDNNDLMSEGDIIYVEAAKPDLLIPNTEYQIYKTKKIAFNRVRHSIKGIIKIIKKKQDYCVAKVIKTYVDINPGDLIMNFLKRDKEFIVKKNNEKINAKLVCNDGDDSILGERQLVYMNLGQNDNIEPGQIYTIYKNLPKKRSAFANKTIAIDPIITGKLIVVHTEDISSTALIFTNNQEIHPGDPVH